MNIYVGVTDFDWYTIVSESHCDEVNFWKPGNSNFRALAENDMFLFKLHSPRNYIVGGGFFVRFSILPTYLAWQAFGIKNGARSLNELNTRIWKYRQRQDISEENPTIGCIILTEPFFFTEENWIPIPDDWSGSIVQGKTYQTETQTGMHLYEEVQARMQVSALGNPLGNMEMRYAEYMTPHRLGQGAFRIAITESYQRRCAITGEKTLPVLEAAHIKPYSNDGPHMVNNGILLRSDFHTLFDDGYMTITPDLHVEVSRRLHDDYGNGKDYYQYHGKSLTILPERMIDVPSREYLSWHNEQVYLG